MTLQLNYKTWRGRCGIYGIRHIATGRIYVGQSQDIGSRWSVHLTSLRANNHHCSYLQNLWNKYGEDSFQFVGLQITTIEQLDAGEIRWFKRFSNSLVNSLPPGHSRRGFKHTIKTKIKMRAIARITSRTPEQRKLRSDRAKKQHLEGRIGYRPVVRPVRICVKCGVKFNRYKLSNGSYHQGESCLICMAATFHKQGGRFNLDQFEVDQDTWDNAAYELTWDRSYGGFS